MKYIVNNVIIHAMENEELTPNNQDENKETKYLDIFPLKRGRRLLVFLADFFIVLIAGIFLFNIATYPIARQITNETKKEEETLSLRHDQYKILYDNEILFYDANEQYIYTANLETTMIKFITYYISDEDTRNIKDESIFHYYHDIRNKDFEFIDTFYKANNSRNVEFFNFEVRDKNGLPTMNPTYISEFTDYLAFPNENKGTQAETDYNTFYQYFFVNAYGNLLQDVTTNDLSVATVTLSYNEIIARIDELGQASEIMVISCAAISYVICLALLMILIPFVTRRGKTPAHYFLKVERVQKETLNLCKAKDKIATSVYYLITFLPALMFIPFPTFGFADLFSFSFIFILSMIGLVLDIASMIYLLFSKYNQTLSDLASLTILITSDNLDSIYRTKGYKHG